MKTVKKVIKRQVVKTLPKNKYDVVTKEWVLKQIETSEKSRKEVAEELNMSVFQLNHYLREKDPRMINKTLKVLFYLYFKYEFK